MNIFFQLFEKRNFIFQIHIMISNISKRSRIVCWILQYLRRSSYAICMTSKNIVIPTTWNLLSCCIFCLLNWHHQFFFLNKRKKRVLYYIPLSNLQHDGETLKRSDIFVTLFQKRSIHLCLTNWRIRINFFFPTSKSVPYYLIKFTARSY